MAVNHPAQNAGLQTLGLDASDRNGETTGPSRDRRYVHRASADRSDTGRPRYPLCAWQGACATFCRQRGEGAADREDIGRILRREELSKQRLWRLL